MYRKYRKFEFFNKPNLGYITGLKNINYLTTYIVY